MGRPTRNWFRMTDDDDRSPGYARVCVPVFGCVCVCVCVCVYVQNFEIRPPASHTTIKNELRFIGTCLRAGWALGMPRGEYPNRQAGADMADFMKS